MEWTSIGEEKLAVLSMEYFNVSGMAGEWLTIPKKNELKFKVSKVIKVKMINQ